MMQLARRASLVILLLHGSVGTASAECAWVLWGQTRDNRYLPMGAGNTSLDSCQDRADLLTKNDKKKTFVYSCLPDTIDPRGPKGR
jgi:hypothetical protein